MHTTKKNNSGSLQSRVFATLSFTLLLSVNVLAADKPNILVIWGDDIGWFNISSYNHGMTGYQTPNIDRIAKEGMMFTDAYGEQSCTAGRSAFITGQHPIRTGLTKVGLPGSTVGLQKEDPTLAELLKPLGYMTAQFGKNHLGDRDEFLPTEHGFDEFLGNLYHLNAEEEPEHADYPKDPRFRKQFGPRGVIRSFADGTVEDIGPLTKKRMETVDEEFLAAGLKFMDRAAKADKPFFMWFNSTRNHIYTHLKPESQGVTGQGVYADGMAEHDGHVGQLLNKLDELKIADNTIVLYSTDNGAQLYHWPDSGIIPFRGEKNTTWEGGFRVPAMVRWPGKIKPGSVSNGIISHLDWLPTLMAAAGQPEIKKQLMQGHQVGDSKFQVYLDGYNQIPHLTGDVPSSRNEFFYFTDDGKLSALRIGDWKMMYSEQRETGFDVWREPLVELRIPRLYNLRRDPFERADINSGNYDHWFQNHAYINFYALEVIPKFLMTFKKYPPRQRPATFTIDQMMEQFMGGK